jgi:predicted CoA-substrate-specific enzyme activase
LYSLGIDIGSITAKAVILDAETKDICGTKIMLTGYNSKETANKLVSDLLTEMNLTMTDINYTVSTGYSRKNVDYSSQQVTEITCQAKGIFYLFPDAHTIIDIGGQDSKAIQIDEKGNMVDFEMNDKCSAGTGRFLEVMANSLEVPLETMPSLSSKDYVPISSTCTVFAESEVVSRIAEGADRNAIIGGIHNSIASKILSLVGRIEIEPRIVVTGGVAKNGAVVGAISEKIDHNVSVPEIPQLTGALGAALIAINKITKLNSKP